MEPTDRHVQIIAQLRQAQRLMAKGEMSVAETLEILKVYEQGVAAMLTAPELMKYMGERMRLADRFFGG